MKEIKKDMKLTPHFTLEEMTASASHPEIKNVPNETQVENLKRVCSWLEDLRALYNRRYGGPRTPEMPILINSGFRSPMLNYVVGGVKTSNHLQGCAADINCPGKNSAERAKMALKYACLLLEIADLRGEKFDEVIIERRGTKWWVHFAVCPKDNGMYVTCLNKGY